MPPHEPPSGCIGLEPWPLDELTAAVLGLPLIALTPTAQLIANGRE